MIEPEEKTRLLDKKAEKDHRALVGRLVHEAKPFGPEGQEALAALRRALLYKGR